VIQKYHVILPHRNRGSDAPEYTEYTITHWFLLDRNPCGVECHTFVRPWNDL